MVDPKVVELSMYNSIPHLLIPVITEPTKAAAALRWAVQEMVKRYNRFAESRVKDIDGFNKAKPKEERMAKIIILIDELADLMMVAAKEVEDSICRIAQMGRAAGMHLVVATQRPSVDVITGLIKANVPSRIAFAVSSSIDSRTILDCGGAEKLLGKGDMLYYPIGETKPKRVQGTFVTEEEIVRVVDYIKRKEASITSEAIEKEIQTAMSGGVEEEKITDEQGKDPILQEAIEEAVKTKKASISFLRRRFRIGDSRAGRIIDDMEKMGIVSAQDGNKPREVLISEYQWLQIKEQGQAKEDSNQEIKEEYEDYKENEHSENNEINNTKEDISNQTFKISRTDINVDEQYVKEIMEFTIKEPYFMDIIDDMMQSDEISVHFLKRTYRLSEQRAIDAINKLQELKMISGGIDSNAVITITMQEFEKINEIFDRLTSDE